MKFKKFCLTFMGKLFWILLLGLLFRLLLLFLWNPLISRDSVEFLKTATYYSKGQFSLGLHHYYPPGYPVLVAFFLKLGCPSIVSGRIVSLLAGLLSILFGGLLLKKPLGEKWALMGAFFLAIHPYGIRYSTMILSESTFCCAILGGWFFYCRGFFTGKIPYFMGAGFFVSYAYLTRPEGVLLFLFFGIGIFYSKNLKNYFQKYQALSSLFLTSFLLIFPYLIMMKNVDISYLKHSQGRWKITLKGGLYESVMGVFLKKDKEGQQYVLTFEKKTFGRFSKRFLQQFLKNSLRWIEISSPIFFFLALMCFFVQVPSDQKTFLILLALSCLGYLCLFSLVRVSSRLVFQLSFPAVILAIFGLKGLFDGSFLKDVWKKMFLLIFILLTTIPVALRPLGIKKTYLRKGGQWILKNFGSDHKIACQDKRIGFYGKSSSIVYIAKKTKGAVFEQQIHHLVKSQKVDFIVLDQKYIWQNKKEIQKKKYHLKVLRKFKGSKKGWGILVFQVIQQK